MNIVYNSPFYYFFFFGVLFLFLCCFCFVFFRFWFFFRLSGCFWRVFGGYWGSYILHLVPCMQSGCCFRHKHTRPSARHCHRSSPSRTVHRSYDRPSHLFGTPGSWDTRSAPHNSPCHRQTYRLNMY